MEENLYHPEIKRACVVLPTYNEAENVRLLVPRIFEQAPKITSHELHVLVVDDESPDGTADEVRLLMQRFPRLHLMTGPKLGLGAAYMRGIDRALRELDPDLLCQMDADLQHDPSMLPVFVALANHGFSLVIGSRFAAGGETPDFSLRRRCLSLLGNWMVRFFGGLPRIHDCTSGYRCLQASLLKGSDLSHLSTRGYSFLSSLLCELLRQGARPIEVPITFGSRTFGDSKLAFRDQLEFLLNIARIRFRRPSEFSRWAFVGASGAVVNLAAYALGTRVAGLRLEVASLVAIELSLLWNLGAKRLLTRTPRQVLAIRMRELSRFHLSTLPAAATNYLSFLLLTRTLGLPDLTATACAITAAVVANYYANSLMSWRDD